MPLFSIFIGLLGKVPKQILSYATAIIIGLFAYKYVKHSIYQDGYDAAVIEMELENKEALDKVILSYKQRSDELRALVQEKDKIASAALQKLSELPKETEVKEVVKVVENSVCKSFSDDYVKLLNEAFGENFFK